MKRIQVLIVDDSAVARQLLTQMLSADPQIEVMAAVADPILAMGRMKIAWPDVIVLDVEMPRMDGITFLRQIMSQRPTPVVICSTLTERGATVTMDALAAGAVSVITKPRVGLKGFLQSSTDELLDEIKSAAQAVLRKLPAAAEARLTRKLDADVIVPHAAATPLRETTEKIVAVGTSTGGTQALEAVLPQLPHACPGLAIVQHMPERFTAAFADRLDKLCEISVKEAANGDRLRRGLALIAPGGRHMVVKRSGAYYYVEVVDGPPVNRHKPSVDVLFRSVAQCAGANAIGVIMTGMGDDGARGLREMRDAGARTIAQDEASCVVFGMPKEAIRFEAAQQVLPLDRIAASIGN